MLSPEPRSEAPTAILSAEEHRRIVELFEIYRDYMKHEDNLINFRVTWFMALQAAMFAAYGFLAQDVFRSGAFKYGDGLFPLMHGLQPFRPSPWLAVVVLLCVFGMMSSVISLFSVRAASRAMKALSRRWRDTVLQGREYEPLPDVMGAGDRRAVVLGWLFAHALPVASLMVWCAIVFAHLCLLPDQPPSAR